MSKFVEHMLQISKSKIPTYTLVGLGFFLLGTTLGYKRAHWQA